jgi:hypothetical protein
MAGAQGLSACRTKAGRALNASGTTVCRHGAGMRQRR